MEHEIIDEGFAGEENILPSAPMIRKMPMGALKSRITLFLEEVDKSRDRAENALSEAQKSRV